MGINPFFSAQAPAKVLLTGEHSVVYGAPAVAVAVDRFATTEIRSAAELGIHFSLTDIKKSVRFTLNALKRVRDRLLQSYYQFMQGKRSIQQVIKAPGELFQFAFASLYDACKLEITQGLDIRLSSTIPIGCGMGSSAATIVSFVRALLHFFNIERGLDWVEKLILEVEQLQHGRASGVDTHISLHGGCVQFQKTKKPNALPLPTAPLWIVNTGTPQTSSGECVEKVHERFGSSCIWSEFDEVTLQCIHALHTENSALLLDSIQQNERLLEKIGVVSQQAKSFIRSIEASGGGAKISGAGTVSGQNCGIILVMGEEPKKVCQQFGYKYFPLKGVESGVTLGHS